MLLPKQYTTFDYSTGETARIDDITGYWSATNTGGFGGPNIAIYDVTKVRFLFSSFLTERNASESITQCLANVEYEVYRLVPPTVGPAPRVTVDTKLYFAGDRFILESDQTPVINSVLAVRETGRYAYVGPFLPQDYYTTFAPSAFGIDQLIFPDSAYTSVYQIFGTAYPEGSFPAGTWIVKGDPLNRITVSTGYSYYAGEVFTTTGTESFTDITGTNEVCEYITESTNTFPLCYNAFVVRDALSSLYTSQGCPCKDELKMPLFDVEEALQQIQEKYTDELNNNDSLTQTLLDKIATIGNVITTLPC